MVMVAVDWWSPTKFKCLFYDIMFILWTVCVKITQIDRNKADAALIIRVRSINDVQCLDIFYNGR